MRRWCILFIAVAVSLSLPACGSSEGGDGGTEAPNTTESDKQVNISILLDLSDRIEPSKYPNSPEHYQRDMAAVEAVVDYFREQTRAKGAFEAKGKIRALFSPTPKSSEINDIAERLSVDLSEMQPAEKKTVYDSLKAWYRTDLQRVYDTVIETKNYIGADIWRFFEEGIVNDYCIESSGDYRNVLIILTDGYMYHKDTVKQSSRRTSYVTGHYLSSSGLRSAEDWQEKFRDEDYGFIPTGHKLENIEVLVLEVNPSDSHLDDYSILKAYWGKWFEEMGINKYRIVKTDLPANTKKTINRFLEQT